MESLLRKCKYYFGEDDLNVNSPVKNVYKWHFFFARRNINNLRYADDTTLMAESKEEQKNLLLSERGEWKS